jgi:hypothetical protein
MVRKTNNGPKHKWKSQRLGHFSDPTSKMSWNALFDSPVGQIAKVVVSRSRSRSRSQLWANGAQPPPKQCLSPYTPSLTSPVFLCLLYWYYGKIYSQFINFRFSLLTLLYPIIDNSLMASVLIKTSLISYGLVSTFAYLVLKTPLLFQISYGFLVTITLYLDICVVKYKPCDVRVFYTAAIFYYTGFVLWNIDNMFCDYLQELRKLIPFIFSPFTQFHALWHCLAGYGSYLHIIFCAHSRALTRNQNVVLIKSWTGVRLKNNDQFKKTV